MDLRPPRLCGTDQVIKFVLLILSACSAFGANYYISPTGSPPSPGGTGTGSLANPWDINSLFGSVNIYPGAVIVFHTLVPGDVVYIRGGYYASPGAYNWWPQIEGAPGNPIVVRSYPGDPRPAFDLLNFFDTFFLDNPARASNVNGFTVHDVDFWNLEFYSSTIARTSTFSGNAGQPNSFAVEGVNIRLIHCYIHDLGDFATFSLAYNNKIYGTISMDHGWLAPDRGHGHGAYVENDNSTGSVKVLQNDFIMTSYDIAVQEFGTAALTRAISFLNNTVMNGGGAPAVNAAQIQWMIGQNSPTNIITNGNVFYVSPALGTGLVQMGWSFDTINGTGAFTNNYVLGPECDFENWTSLTATGNHIFAGSGARVAAYLYNCNGNPCVNPPGTPQSFTNWTVNNNIYGSTTFTTGSQYIDSGTFNPVVSNNTNSTTPSIWQTAISGDASSTFNATGALTIWLNPSSFIPGWTNISIWNPAGLSTVTVNLSTLGIPDGAAYSLFDVQNFGNGGGTNGTPVQTGTYSAATATITVPATGLTRKAMLGGAGTPAHTEPYMLTFILQTGLALSGNWTTTGTALASNLATGVSTISGHAFH